jgi:lysozyme
MTLAKTVRVPSKACASFMKDFEKCRLEAYMPTPKDRPTIGWGTTGPDVKLGMKWTQEQADKRFACDLADFAAKVHDAIGDAHTTQGQFDAMVSLAYNIGITAFRGSTVLRKHILGDHHGAEAAFGMWVKQAGQVLNGLVRRRAGEAAIYRADP